MVAVGADSKSSRALRSSGAPTVRVPVVRAGVVVGRRVLGRPRPFQAYPTSESGWRMHANVRSRGRTDAIATRPVGCPPSGTEGGPPRDRYGHHWRVLQPPR